MEDHQITAQKPSTLRWKILRQALLRRPLSDDEKILSRVSRKAKQGFNLIPCQLIQDVDPNPNSRHVCFRYTLPTHPSPKPLLIFQRRDSCTDINDFEVCNKFEIDNTGLVCPWPSEEILSYYCSLHADMFRSKRIIELGSGYGLAGLVIAAVSEASEVVISDGNPQVIDYIQQSVTSNSGAFGDTIVNPMLLHWNQDDLGELCHKFDYVIASDCTFFKDFHGVLVRTVKSLLKDSGLSEAIFFSPRRGDSLDKFLEEIQKSGMRFSLSERYEERIWNRHQELFKGDESWVNYESDHCYPCLVKITR